MRITHSWANAAHTNSLLKIVSVCLALTTATVSFLALHFGSRAPLVVERACQSKVIPLADSGHTQAEIEAFLKSALKARFDTAGSNSHLIGVKELKRRVLEQKVFAKQEMKQKVLIEAITLDGDSTTVQMNRLISVKDIRSALIFRVQVNFAKVRRSEQNPFGLVLTKVTELERPKEDQAKEKK